MNCSQCGLQTTNLKFCSEACQKANRTTKTRESFISGGYAGKHVGFSVGKWGRKFLTELLGYKCACCGISSWNDVPIVLEVNHKDGDALNNVLANLEFLCPNCHSQTDTHGFKNARRSTRKRK